MVGVGAVWLAARHGVQSRSSRSRQAASDDRRPGMATMVVVVVG